MPGPQTSRRRRLPRAYQGYDSQDIFPSDMAQDRANTSTGGIASRHNSGAAIATSANAVSLYSRSSPPRAGLAQHDSVVGIAPRHSRLDPTESAHAGSMLLDNGIHERRGQDISQSILNHDSSTRTFDTATVSAAGLDAVQGTSASPNQPLQSGALQQNDAGAARNSVTYERAAVTSSDSLRYLAQDRVGLRLEDQSYDDPYRVEDVLYSGEEDQEDDDEDEEDDEDDDDEDDDDDDNVDADEDGHDEDNDHDLEDDCEIGDDISHDPEDFMDFLLGTHGSVSSRSTRANSSHTALRTAGSITTAASAQRGQAAARTNQNNDSDAPSDSEDDVNDFSANEDFQSTSSSGSIRAVRSAQSASFGLATHSSSRQDTTRDDMKEDSAPEGSSSYLVTSNSTHVPVRSRGPPRRPLNHSSGSRLVNLSRAPKSAGKCASSREASTCQRRRCRPRAPWVTATSYLQPGIVLDGLQTLSPVGASELCHQSDPAARQRRPDLPSVVRRLAEIRSRTRNNHERASEASHTGLIPHDALPVELEPVTKQTYTTYEEWQVTVTLHSVDLGKGLMEGYMEAVNVPRSAKSVITYFTGEIVDFVNHTLWTDKWKSSPAIDLQYWRKLKPFEEMAEKEIRKGLRSRKWLHQFCKDWVLMRWKEQSFINVRPHESGLTIDGFYYVCLRRSDGMTEGLYFDPSSSPYQKLRLYPHFDTKGYSSSTWEYR